MRFKVGDNVRIACPGSDLNGRVGRIYNIQLWPTWSARAIRLGARRWHRSYQLDVVGIGRFADNGNPLGFPAFLLRPATDPRAQQFIEDMRRFASVMQSRVFALSPSQLNRVRGGQ